jgi:asparagine synthase (glutamine-hydrolysing)
MCGISGIIDRQAAGERLLPAVRRMTDALQHRGPDGGDVQVLSPAAPGVVLGHRRLAIIDLSPAGGQPMVDGDTGVVITYNGEIYNFLQLRRELEGCGHSFRTNTDTEVMLRGYAQWGLEMPKRLRGIFAFALWDPRRRLALLVRDPLGIKPLYVHRTADRLMFASEVRALLASGDVPRTLDVDGLRSYLAFGSVQEPLTLVRGVRSLPPGCMLVMDDHTTREQRFHELPEVAAEDRTPSSELLREALRAAVASQLISDVPLGAFLSGGIDSTAIAVLMRQAKAAEVRTFNVCFRDGGVFDERTFAHLAARAANASHTDIELGEQEFLNNLDAAMAAYDQPSMDGVNTWFVSRAVRGAGLTVALAGVGGDELFVGYNRFAKARRAERWGRPTRALPRSIRRPIGQWLERNGRRESLRQGGTLLSSELAPYFSTRRLFGPGRADALLHDSLRDGGREDWTSVSLAPLSERLEHMEPINKVSRLEIETYMLSTLLRDTDQMGMAHSLEVRVPLIDQDLVELVLPISGRDKISRTTPKRLLVEPLGDALPPECVYRAKRGFTLPFAQWLKSGEGIARITERFAGRNADVYPFDFRAMTSLQRDFLDGSVSWSRVWSLYVLRDWLVRHRIAA